jgi:hypothetical protein
MTRERGFCPLCASAAGTNIFRPPIGGRHPEIFAIFAGSKQHVVKVPLASRKF